MPVHKVTPAFMLCSHVQWGKIDHLPLGKQTSVVLVTLMVLPVKLYCTLAEKRCSVAWQIGQSTDIAHMGTCLCSHQDEDKFIF